MAMHQPEEEGEEEGLQEFWNGAASIVHCTWGSFGV